MISPTIQGNMRAEYDTEMETAQICKFSTAQTVLKSTTPPTPPTILAKRQNKNYNAKLLYSMSF